MSGLDELGISKIEIAPLDNVKEPNFEYIAGFFDLSEPYYKHDAVSQTS
jgi:hypothetical protein